MSNAEQSHNFEHIVRPHLDRLYRLAWRLTGSKAEAEDLFQELLVKAYGLLDDLIAIEEPGSWLSRVMYNLFVDQHRRYTRQRMHLVDEALLPGAGLADLAGDLDPVAPPLEGDSGLVDPRPAVRLGNLRCPKTTDRSSAEPAQGIFSLVPF